MKIPVAYVSYNIAREPLLFGDQVMMKDIFDNHNEFEITKGLNSRLEGAIVSMALFQNELYIENLNADIAKLKWVIIILTANEFGSEAYKKIKHPNMKIWLQTPKQSDQADRFLPLGYPTQITRKAYDKKYDWYFAGQVTNPHRVACVKVLEKIPNGRLLKTPGFGLGYEFGEYIKYMGESKIAPCPSGPATPDTYRVYEALESGCIPIVDSPWYWEKVLQTLELPMLNDWSELPRLMKFELDKWHVVSEDISNWWKNFKGDIYTNLINDIKELRSAI